GDNVNNKVYYYNYDIYGRLISVIDESGNKVSYGYDPLQGDLNKYSYNINGFNREINYFTDYLNNLYDKTTYDSQGQTVTKKYNYDTYLLQRLLGFTVTYGSTQIFKENLYYDD